MTFQSVAAKASKAVADNSPLILTAIGVTGTITTAILTHRAALRADEIIREEKKIHPEIEPRERLILTWKVYAAPVGMGCFTVAAIIAANRIGTRRAAAMAAAYSLSERAFTEYKDKVLETVGKTKEQKVRDDIAQDRVNNDPVGKQSVIITGGGDVLCYEMYTGRYFMSSMEALKKAQNDLNYKLLNNDYASLSDFYNLVGLSNTTTSDDLGWRSGDKLLDLEFSTTMSDDQRPCIAVNFRTEPFRNYYRQG